MSFKNLIAAASAVTLVQLGQDGQAVVADAVNAAQAVEGGDSAKFDAAVSQATTDLTNLGKDVGLEIIHLAIEATVAALTPTEPAASNAVSDPAPSPVDPTNS